MDDAHFMPDRIESLVQEIEVVSSVVAELPRQILLTDGERREIINAGSRLTAALRELQQKHCYPAPGNAGSENVHSAFTDGLGQNSGAYS